MENAVQALKAHLAINVKDVEASIGFYKKLFGIEPSKVRTGYAKFNVQNPPLNFTLNQAPFAGRGALSHLGIQVGSTEDVIAVREQWQKSGLEPRAELQTSCCYALQDKAWVSDPDGNEWEVFVVLQDNLPEPVNAGICCASIATEKAEAAEAKPASSATEVPTAGVASSCGCSDTVGIAR